MKITEAITAVVRFHRDGLHGCPKHPAPDIFDRYEPGMEVQLMADPSKGTPVEGKRGVYQAIDNELVEYWSIRIPKNAGTNPSFADREAPFPLFLYCNAMGLTGWHGERRVSRWIAIDVDAIEGHAAGVGISAEDRKRIGQAVARLDYVEHRGSSSGRGDHLYVWLDDIPCPNHTVHANDIGKRVLAKMSHDTGIDLSKYADGVGGNVFVISPKATAENGGFRLIKAATTKLTADDLPELLQDELPEPDFDHVELTEDHRVDLRALAELGHATSVTEKGCFPTHTALLAKIVRRGRFKTVSEGRDLDHPNCFLWPRPQGWRVVRFGKGTKEDVSWTHGEWTWTYLNRCLDLETAAKEFGGLPHKGGFAFPNFNAAQQALGMVIEGREDAAILPPVDDEVKRRQVHITVRADNHGSAVVAKIKKCEGDRLNGWVEDGRSWVFEVVAEVATNHAKDDAANRSVAYVVQPDRSGFRPVGWAVKLPEGWQWITTDDLAKDLIGRGIKNPTAFMAKAMRRRLHIDYVPFKPARYENKLNFGCRYACKPSPGAFPMTQRVLDHVGQSLDSVVLKSDWCVRYGITTGGEFLTVVIANVLQRPELKSPLLFMHGDEQCGKSTLFDLLRNLIGPGGIAEIDKVVGNDDKFDDQLAGAVVGIIDELDASNSKIRPKLRRWITEDRMWVNAKFRAALEVPNYTHWIQAANNIEFAPAGTKDTRVIYLAVPLPKDPIGRDELKAALRREAPAYLHHCLGLKLPEPIGRFSVPVLETRSKVEAMSLQTTALETFVADRCEIVPEVDGEWQARIASKEFDEAFIDFLTDEGDEHWTAPAIHKALTKMGFPYRTGKGRKGFVHNLRWRDASA